MKIKQAIIRANAMTDRALSYEVSCGPYWWLVAAIATGRRTPADLAGHKGEYRIPRSLPWHPRRERERERRLRALVARELSKAPTLAGG